MVENVFSISGASLVLLAVVEALGRKKLAFLPLGGDHIVQTGIVLGFAFVVLELARVVVH